MDKAPYKNTTRINKQPTLINGYDDKYLSILSIDTTKGKAKYKHDEIIIPGMKKVKKSL
ncbi:unnamed protein product [Klebsiella pneumoniae]|nr:unnamed protein product [Klebsiella pneumoniae]